MAPALQSRGLEPPMKCKLFFFAILLILEIPYTAFAQYNCDDVKIILRTHIQIEQLNKKYKSQIRSKQNRFCNNYFYETFIEDEYEDIYRCLVDGDDNLLNMYILFVLENVDSADEQIPSCLGMLYIDRKQDMNRIINEYNTEIAACLYSNIALGVYLTDNENNLDPEDTKLLNIIDKIKKESP